MKAGRVVITAVAALALWALPALPPATLSADTSAAWLSLSGGNATFKSQVRTVFPDDVPNIRASVAIPADTKRRAEFVWRDPSGKVYSDKFKMLFMDKASGAAIGWDELAVADSPPSEMPGWWTLDVTTPGESLSVRFLLTKNRQEAVLVNGTKEKKLEYLKTINAEGPESFEAIKLGLTDPDEDVRAMAVRVLRAPLAAWAVQLLLALEDDPSATVRAAVAEALSGKGGGFAFDALTRAAGDADPVVRRAAASRLPVEGYEAGSAGLLGGLVKDDDPLIRTIALASLAGMRGEPAMKALKEGFSVDDPSFRSGVLAVVVSRGGPGMYDTLVRALDDPEPTNRLAALKALGTDAASVADGLVLDPDETVAGEAMKSVKGPDGLARALGSAHQSVRLKAVEGLARQGGGRGVPGLTQALKDEDLAVRRTALNGLVSAGRDGLGGFAYALDDTVADIRLTAANALVNADAHDAGPELMKALDDKDPRVRSAALLYFSDNGGDGLADILGRFACDTDKGLRKSALGRLTGLTRSEAGSRALAGFYACGDADTRATVIDSLAERDDKEAVAVVENALTDPEPGIRRSAVVALFDMGIKGPLPALAHDPDPVIKKLALRVMSESPEPSMLPDLDVLIKDEDKGVKELALGILKSIPGDEAGRLISYLAADTSIQVGMEAKRILLTRRDTGSTEGLGVMATDGDDRSRLDAMAALDDIPGDASDEALYKAFASGGPVVRLAALGYLADRKAGTLLKAASEGATDQNGKVGLASLAAAGSLPAEDKDAVADAALSSTDADVREAALLWFRERDGDAAVAGLLKGLDDPAGSLRALALGSLTGREGVRLGPRLPGLFTDADPEVRRLAVWAASRRTDSAEAAGLLVAAAEGPYGDTAGAAVEALMPSGDARALPSFMRAYREGRSREELLGAMAKVEGDAGTDALAYAYGESADDERLRLLAVKYLSARGDGALAALLTALDDPSRKVRELAIKSAPGLGADARVRLLGKAIGDNVLDLRKLAADGLADIPGEGSARALLPALDDMYLRDNALKTLLSRGPETLALMSGFLAEVKDDGYRAELVKALGKAGLDTARLSVSLDDPSARVRLEAVKAVARQGGIGPASGLLYAVGDEDARVRSFASSTLKGMSPADVSTAAGRLVDEGRATASSLGFAAGFLTDPVLLKALIDKIPADRADLLSGALRPLMERRGPSDAAALAAGLKAEGPSMRENITAALVSTEGPGTGQALRDAYALYPAQRPDLIRAACGAGRAGDITGMALADADPANRRAGAACLDTLGEKGLLGALEVAIKDADPEVRMSAVKAATGSGHLELAAGAAGDASPEVRRTVAAALGSSGSGDAAGLLAMLALDTDDTVAAEAAYALAGLGDKVPPKVWSNLLTAAGSTVEVRLAALKAVSARVDSVSAGMRVHALKDKDRQARTVAADSLVAVGKDSLPYVHPLLKDPAACIAALDVIKRIADPSSDEAVVQAMPGMDGAARLAAVDALGGTGGPAAASALVGIYNEAGGMRKAAVRAMGGLKGGGTDESVIAALRDALESGDDGIRLYAARSAGSLKAKALKDALAARQKVEESGLVLSAIEEALKALSPPEL